MFILLIKWLAIFPVIESRHSYNFFLFVDDWQRQDVFNGPAAVIKCLMLHHEDTNTCLVLETWDLSLSPSLAFSNSHSLVRFANSHPNKRVKASTCLLLDTWSHHIMSKCRSCYVTEKPNTLNSPSCPLSDTLATDGCRIIGLQTCSVPLIGWTLHNARTLFLIENEFKRETQFSSGKPFFVKNLRVSPTL